jgi:hypothetical protein
MGRRALVTVVTRNYIHFALALAESARIHQPDADFFICFADAPLSDWQHHAIQIEASAAEIQSFGAWELGIEPWRRMAFQYTPFELSCALKPFALQHVRDRGYTEIVYLDADMQLYRPLQAVFEALQTESIVLTPHLLRPYPDDGQQPGEDLFLIAGTFNAGLVAVRSDETGTAFLTWWAQRLRTQCHQDMSGSFYVDQKWLSLAPGLFAGVHILRDPGYNAGHWTLPQFDLERSAAGEPSLGGRPLALFHFSGFSPGDPGTFLKFQSRLALAQVAVLQALVSAYHAAVNRYDRQEIVRPDCEYDKLRDGTRIRPQWREAVRRGHACLAGEPDPFEAACTPASRAALADLEQRAVKWRKDWQLKGAVRPATPNRWKRAERRVKNWLRKAGIHRKLAG